MSIAVNGRTTSRNGSTDDPTSHIVQMGNVGWAVDDIALIWFFCDGNETVTIPDDFIAIDPPYSPGIGNDSSSCYKVVDGTESWFSSGGSVTYLTGSGEGSGHIVYRISGADTAVPPEATQAGGSGSANPDCPSISPSWGVSASTLFLAVYGADGSTGNVSYPSGYSNGVNIPAKGGHSGGVMAAGAEKIATVASEDPPSATITNLDEWIGWTIAVKEAGPLTESGSFTADALLLLETSSTFTADSVIVVSLVEFTADAMLLDTTSGSFTAQSIILYSSSGSFTANAVLLVTSSALIDADALLLLVESLGFTADAIISNAISDSVTANSVIRGIIDGGFTADAILRAEILIQWPVSIVPLPSHVLTPVQKIAIVLPGAPNRQVRIE